MKALLTKLTNPKWKLYYELSILFIILTYSILLLQSSFDSIPDFLGESEMIWLDRGILLFFLVEYSIRLIRTKDRWRFIRKNWFDLIAMLPFDELFRLARLMRLIRLIRLIRMSTVLSAFFRSKEIVYALLVVGVIVLWGAGAFYLIEGNQNDNISSLMDAVWWAIVTTTTVGYGDISPITLGGAHGGHYINAYWNWTDRFRHCKCRIPIHSAGS